MIDLMRIAELADEYTFGNDPKVGQVGGTLRGSELSDLLGIAASTLEAHEIGRAILPDEEPFSAARGLMDDLNAEREARQADRLIRDGLLQACRIALALTVSPSSDTYEADVEKIRAAIAEAEGR